MRKQAGAPIAWFVPGRSIARLLPSLAVGVSLALVAQVFAWDILTSDWATPRTRVVAPPMLALFGVAALVAFGWKLPEAARAGVAVLVDGDTLRAFTGYDGAIRLQEIWDVRPSRSGGKSSVLVYDEGGLRLVIRADLMRPDARVIAKAIKAAIPAS